jgi:hypothetical protein
MLRVAILLPILETGHQAAIIIFSSETQPGTSFSHAIGVRCPRLAWVLFSFHKHLGHPHLQHQRPVQNWEHWFESTHTTRFGSRRTDLVESIPAQKLEGVCQPSFLRPLRTINANRGAENAESMCFKTNEDGDARHDRLRFSLRKLHRMGRPVQ